jgi:hypothetical protein
VSNEHNPIERAVDLLVFAPIGVAMFAKDTVPTFLKMFVARGQTELAQRKKSLHNQANQYRTVGKLAVKYGGPEVKRQAEGKIDGARRLAEETFSGLVVARSGGADQPAPEPKVETSSTSITKPPAANGAANSASVGTTNGNVTNGVSAAGEAARSDAPVPHIEPSLAIPGYDQLSASQVVERLDGLTPGELDAVRDYEIAHRGRSTILGKITQLTN